jgi:hypothetical protein
MPRSILIIIESDPRQSGRAAEAVRIAAGIGAWKKVDVAVYLRGAAAMIAGEEAGEFVDGENFARYLPLLERRVYAQKGAMAAQPAVPIVEITDEQLAGMAAARDCVLRF